jgi:chitinase
MFSRFRRTSFVLSAAVLVATATTGTAEAAVAASKNVVAYYQTQYSGGAYVSPDPLRGIASDIEVGAFHLNGDGSIHLNDDPPSAGTFTQMWSDLGSLQQSGVRVDAMLGGAAQGSYANLHNDFTTYYGLLKNTLQTYHFNGIDLDIEETFSLADTEHLISQLRSDFGTGFVITLAPVATDMTGSSNFSGGFDYRTLESDIGSQIDWYNVQFYCGWGSLDGTSGYDGLMGSWRASRIVAGTVTNPANCSGYVDPAALAGTIRSLVAEHSDFGGIAGWEYFNSTGVNGGGPESWYQNAKSAMG